MKNSKDPLGTRMKEYYENRSRHYLLSRCPVIVRVDGKAFHSFTKSYERPFDDTIHQAMIASANAVMNESSGCVMAYTQSDECSFLFIDDKEINTQAWFNNNQSKIESVIASIYSVTFSMICHKAAYFDARAFNVPYADVPNYFLWRGKDAVRNSINGWALKHFSHKHLTGVSSLEKLKMLQEQGDSWEQSPLASRYGTIITKNDLIHTPLDSYTNAELIVNKALAQ